MKSSREQFEEWFDEYTYSAPGRCKILRSGIGYRNVACQEQWEAWQASRAAIEIELPSKEDPENFFCEVYDCDMVHESLANCGLKVKS